MPSIMCLSFHSVAEEEDDDDDVLILGRLEAIFSIPRRPVLLLILLICNSHDQQNGLKKPKIRLEYLRHLGRKAADGGGWLVVLERSDVDEEEDDDGDDMVELDGERGEGVVGSEKGGLQQ
ncbi:hypothetical protein ACLOJK_041335 [Asimina triloba]